MWKGGRERIGVGTPRWNREGREHDAGGEERGGEWPPAGITGKALVKGADLRLGCEGVFWQRRGRRT